MGIQVPSTVCVMTCLRVCDFISIRLCVLCVPVLQMLRRKLEMEVLDHADVVCCTCVGAGDPRLSNSRFQHVSDVQLQHVLDLCPLFWALLSAIQSRLSSSWKSLKYDLGPFFSFFVWIKQSYTSLYTL